ncbi:alpha/beta fold hydrolase [Streptomyces sp. NPDC058239]|uniref:alpha/beta fold hydrolase n=1 Tax=Streptomyces sp. NPDC058239 TaxID=3346395 RepID=UPI0036E98235
MYSPAWRAATTLGDPGMPAHARRCHLVAGKEHDVWDALPRISMPTLILHGAQDRLTPPNSPPLLAARIPGARAHVFLGTRHAYFEECRSEARALVTAFLNEPP